VSDRKRPTDASRDTDKDLIEAESTMGYIEEMGAAADKVELFVVLEIVRSPGLGQMSRKGYVDGWQETGIAASESAHQHFVRQRITNLTNEPELFKRVYRYAFVAGKDVDQKAMQLDRALTFWEMFFDPSVRPWKSANVDWLAHWKKFLEQNWTKSVSKDMWNQTLEFATKSTADEALSFWEEDSAWPTVIDDFVKWYRSEGMDVD
jgi:DCN1-like protein 1/2